MPQRFGQADDYSQQFAYLAQQNNMQMERAAERVDARREEELAARDAEMFTRYQEGKVSGAEILAYIQQRVNQTGYDKAQQRKWKATLVEFRNQVADERATAAYEETGNLGAFIEHWKKRLSGTKNGTPERTQIQKVLSQLREQRDQRNITNGANRIMRQIQNGTKSTKDLIAFYKDALNKEGLSAEMRSQVKDTIVQLTAQHKKDQYTIAQMKVDERLARGDISPQEAAKMKEGNAQKWDINTTDPVSYQQLQGEIRVLNATPDPVEVAQAEADLKAGKITAGDFSNMMDHWAEQIAPFDQKAAWELRGTARELRREYESAQRLENPDIIGQRGTDGATGGRAAGVVNTFLGNRLAHISQLDGSKYSMVNCTMASAAMMGHTLGTRGYSGADYRALTKDTVGGTTLLQAKYALEQNGVDGLRYRDGFSYDKFKTNVKQGSTVMLSGYLGNLPSGSFHNAGLRANHTVYVARYDPQKGYLVLDPARSAAGYKGTWVSESVIRKFAWTGSGLGVYSRNGSVLMAPKGTLKTEWNQGKTYDPRKTGKTSAAKARSEQSKKGSAAGGKSYEDYVDIEDGVAFISVEAPAQTKWGSLFEGRFNPGPNETADLVAGINASIDKNLQYHNEAHYDRLRNAGITPGDEALDTKDEVLEAIEDRTKATANISRWVEGFAQAYTGGDGAVRVVVGSEVRYLTREDASALERELVVALDGLSLLNQSVGNSDAANLANQTISETILTSQAITTTDMGWERNQMFRNQERRLEAAGGDPDAVRAVIEEIAVETRQFADNWVDDNPEALGPNPDPNAGEGLGPVDQPATEQDAMVGALDKPSQVIGEGKDMKFIGNEAADRATLFELMADTDADPDFVNQQVIAYAERYDIELNPNWPEPMEAGQSAATGEGGWLSKMATETNTLRDLEWERGEMVLVEGGYHYVPYVYDGGITQTGARSEELGSVPTEQLTDEPVPEGMEQTIVGTSPTRSLDLDYIKNVLKVNLDPATLVNGLPKAFVLGDNGEPTAISVVPKEIPYSGANMIRIQNAETVTAFFESRGLTVPQNEEGEALADGDMVSADMLESFPPSVVTQLSRGGEDSGVTVEPFMVWTMQLPGQQGVWFQDPGTEKWHLNGLPFVGNDMAMPGADPRAKGDLGYIGAVYDEGMGGRAVPDSQYWGITDGDYTTGVVTPVGQGIDRIMATALHLAGEGNPDSMVRRNDADGSFEPYTAEDAAYTDQYIEVGLAAKAIGKARDAAIKAANDAWTNLKNVTDPEQRLQTMSGFEDMRLDAMGGGLPSLDMVGASDTNADAQKKKAPWAFDASKLHSALFDGNIMDSIQKGLESYKNQQPTFDIPKIEWSAPGDNPGGVKGMQFNPELGYQSTSPSDYAPNPAEG